MSHDVRERQVATIKDDHARVDRLPLLNFRRLGDGWNRVEVVRGAVCHSTQERHPGECLQGGCGYSHVYLPENRREELDMSGQSWAAKTRRADQASPRNRPVALLM